MISNLSSFVVLILIIYLGLRPYLISKHSISKWTKQKGFEVLKKKVCFLNKGPFNSAYNRAVYRLLLKTEAGEEKCWIMCGDIFLSNPERIKIVWDKDFKSDLPFVNLIKALFSFFINMLSIVLLLFLALMFIFDINI